MNNSNKMMMIRFYKELTRLRLQSFTYGQNMRLTMMSVIVCTLKEKVT